MRYEYLGTSNLKVSKICLGTMTFGEQVSENLSFDLLNFANEKGINFIDTAEMYPVYPKKETHGDTERIIGKWIKEKKEVSSFISNFVNDYDTDNNGKLDILENDGFAKLLKSNQSKIIEVDKSYIQKFVKLSLYIKTKSKNLQKTFTLIKDAQELKEINNLHLVFESQYHSYAVTIFESFKIIFWIFHKVIIGLDAIKIIIYFFKLSIKTNI